MTGMERYLETNRDLWDGWTEIHRQSSFYALDAFLAGGSSLNEIEVAALGDVKKKKLLHLQCHFGQDTLSWARLGAETTGVDFSERAIDLARDLAMEVGLTSQFLCAEVTSLPAEWTERFDVVFSSYGVLPWLPDLNSWARTIERVLRPGGDFHLVEFHPLTGMLDDDGRTMRYPYFHSPVPGEHKVQGSYAEREAPFSHGSFEWAHSLEDLLMALIGAGLTICEFREFPYSPYGCFEYLEEEEPGRWEVRGAMEKLPLVFRLRASKREKEGAGPAC